VASRETLPGQLNRLSSQERFVNLGLEGIHPAAMAGLLQYYGRAIAGQAVLLHFNPLWITSPQRDLQGSKEQDFNHPALVPQLHPWLACYGASLAERIGVVVGHRVPLWPWARHLQITCLDSRDLPHWTLEHPYQSPDWSLLCAARSPDEIPSPPPVAEPWNAHEARPVRFAWVELPSSFQWQCFQRTVDRLQQRGNKVFVVVGPFNEHMLADASRQRYQALKAAIDQALTERRIAHHLAPLLPSAEYADASHPLAAGYARMAAALQADPALAAFMSD
jgi:hypothetical protein